MSPEEASDTTGALDPAAERRRAAGEFRRGFLAMLPLWIGVAPFGATFAILARDGGFSVLETQALSMLVFAGSAQIAVVTLASTGATLLTVVLTTFLLNLRHILYAVSLTGSFGRRGGPPRPLLAFFLTDESYGVAIRDAIGGRGSAGFLFGASISLYICFAASTLAGSLLGERIPAPERLGLDFIFPLCFLALLLPLLRSLRQVVVAAFAAMLALAIGRLADGGTAVLVSTIVAAAAGAALDSKWGR